VPEEVFAKSLDVSAKGGILFSQATLPLLLKGVEQKSQYPPSLIFTGATASVKANALMASFATGKWALRALSQSLAREFGPQGVHVSHAIIDGVIDIPRTKEWLKDMGPEAKLSADGVRFDIRLLTDVARSTNVTRLLTTTGGCTLSRRRTLPGRSTCDLQSRNGDILCRI
jgi:NAD(P)-dependent dehydrogenase (short-subunit alcohol dehydrogenase family)